MKVCCYKMKVFCDNMKVYRDKMKVYRDKTKVYRDKLDREAEKKFRRLCRRKFFSGREHNRKGPHGPPNSTVGGPMGPRSYNIIYFFIIFGFFL